LLLGILGTSLAEFIKKKNKSQSLGEPNGRKNKERVNIQGFFRFYLHYPLIQMVGALGAVQQR